MISNTNAKDDTASFDGFTELERKTTCEKIYVYHNKLREALIEQIEDDGDYSYPETDDGYISGYFTEEPNWDVLKRICEFVASKGNTSLDGGWTKGQLFDFLRNDIQKYHDGDLYSISLSFGGLAPILALLPFLAVCSKVCSLAVIFAHDKWEIRGDYSAESHVGVKLKNKKLLIGSFEDEVDFCDDEDEIDSEWIQKRRDTAAKEWLRKYGNLVTKDQPIYFNESVFAFTGLGTTDRINHPLVAECLKKGGIFRRDVSRNVHYLVVDPSNAGDSKIRYVQSLHEMGFFVDVILKEDLEKALNEKRSEAQEAEIKEKVLRRREIEAEARRVKKEKEDQIRRQEQAKKEEIRRQAQKEDRMILRHTREAQKAEEKAKREAYIAQTLVSIQEQCTAKGKKYISMAEFYTDVKRAEIGFAEIERYIYGQYQQKPEEYLIHRNILMTEQERLRAQLDEVIHILAARYAAAQKKAMSVTEVWEENPDIDKRLILDKAVFCTGKTPRDLLTEKGIIYCDDELLAKQNATIVKKNEVDIPENIRKRMDILFTKLDEAYPDKVVVRLHQDHKKWGETVTALYRALDYPDYRSFLEAYGYKVNTEDKGGRPKKDPMEIINELKRRYPNGTDFTNVDELKAANPDIASRFQNLRNKANEYFGMPFTQYLRSIGLIK